MSTIACSIGVLIATVLPACGSQDDTASVPSTIVAAPDEPGEPEPAPAPALEPVPGPETGPAPEPTALAPDSSPDEQPLVSTEIERRPRRGRDGARVRAQTRVLTEHSRSRGELAFARRGASLVVYVRGHRATCGAGVDFENAWVGDGTIRLEPEDHEHDPRAPSRCLYYVDYEVVLPLPEPGVYSVDVRGTRPYEVTIPRGDEPRAGAP